MAPEEKTKPESDYSRQTVGKRGLRTGYTTGSCAAAAAKGAVIALLTGQPVQAVTIHLPVGRDATFSLNRCEWVDDERVLVKVIRPAGEPGRFHLISNGSEEPIFDQAVMWAAKVTGMKPR